MTSVHGTYTCTVPGIYVIGTYSLAVHNDGSCSVSLSGHNINLGNRSSGKGPDKLCSYSGAQLLGFLAGAETVNIGKGKNRDIESIAEINEFQCLPHSLKGKVIL